MSIEPVAWVDSKDIEEKQITFYGAADKWRADDGRYDMPLYPQSAINELQRQLELRDDCLVRIKQWCEAYPLDIFPEPDLKKAREVLKANGMTIDALSASSARHVLKGVCKIIEESKHE